MAAVLELKKFVHKKKVLDAQKRLATLCKSMGVEFSVDGKIVVRDRASKGKKNVLKIKKCSRRTW